MLRSPRSFVPRPSIAQPQPRPRFFPSGRYARTNPLCRWFDLHLLAESLPEPLRSSLIHAWMHPGRYDGNQAIQSEHRQRCKEDFLPLLPPARLVWMAFVELAVARRIVEVARTEITRDLRSALLRSQGVYLRALYAALAAQLGEAAALAEFERLLPNVA